MKKSVISTAVTTVFIVYSLYQRVSGAVGVTGVAAGPNIGNTPSSASQSSSSNQTPIPPSSSRNPAQSNPSRPRSGNASPSTPPNRTAPNSPAPNTRAPTQGSASAYKDGTYSGVAANAFYGNVQVQATISNGQLTDVQILQWPNDRSRSIAINRQALPWLAQEAIQAQSASVNIISGATDTSRAFAQSLNSALARARS